MRGLRFKRPVRPLFVGPRAGRRSCARRDARSEYPRARAAGRRGGAEAARPAAARATRPRQALDSRRARSRCSASTTTAPKRLVVIRDAGASRPLLEITLAHELVHALEDQRFGLDVPEGVPRRRGARRDGARRGHGDGADGRLREAVPEPRRRARAREPARDAGAAAVHREAAPVPLSGGGAVRERVPRRAR